MPRLGQADVSAVVTRAAGEDGSIIEELTGSKLWPENTLTS